MERREAAASPRRDRVALIGHRGPSVDGNKEAVRAQIDDPETERDDNEDETAFAQREHAKARGATAWRLRRVISFPEEIHT